MDPRQARIKVLGGPSIDVGDGQAQVASLPSGRAELVFAYLAVEHARTVSRDELANALWPGMLPDSWAAALRSVVTEVRRFLAGAGFAGDEVIENAHGGYRLNLPPGVRLDLDDAREELARAHALLERQASTEAAAAAARSAALSGLPFLPHQDGDWVQQIRVELQGIHATALELCTRAYLLAGDARAARTAAERLIRAEPYSEAPRRLLIAVLGEAGDRAGAMRAYEEYRAVMQREFGLKPSAEIEAALRSALADRSSSPAPRADAQPALSAPAIPSVPGGPHLATVAVGSVLVVEDHDFQRRAALALLRRLGVGTLHEAADGAAALELLSAIEPPEVMICDIDMPGMDGIEFIRNVARRGLASAVVIASGLDRAMLDSVQGITAGYGLQLLGAVEKPLTVKALADLLGSYRPPVEPDGGNLRRLSAAEIEQGMQEGAAISLAPIADLRAGRIAAAELVPTWSDGDGAVAASFAAVLESPELIERFDEWLLASACAAVAELDAAGSPLELAFRLPHARLTDATLADRLAGVVRAAGAEPDRLVLIVGEAAIPGAVAVSLDVLARLRLKGFGLWLDCSGPAAGIARVPITGLRISPTLLAGAAGDSARAAVLQAAVDLARERGIASVGSGCATADELAMLLDVGASHAQGELIGSHRPVREMATWAAAWTPPSLGGEDAG